LGATLVLHTWTRELLFHPHIHAIVTGGGLAHDKASWRASRPRFLFAVHAMSRVFRAKMLAALAHAHRMGAFAHFRDFADPQGFAFAMQRIAKKSWNVYSKAPFRKGRHVLDYLGRYTHRVGMANSRLVRVTPQQVTFRTKRGACAVVSPVEFLRRFVRHVLPDRFHKIRHIGLYAPASHELCERARALVSPVLGSVAAVTVQGED
jgi:hypothetical protein